MRSFSPARVSCVLVHQQRIYLLNRLQTGDREPTGAVNLQFLIFFSSSVVVALYACHHEEWWEITLLASEARYDALQHAAALSISCAQFLTAKTPRPSLIAKLALHWVLLKLDLSWVNQNVVAVLNKGHRVSYGPSQADAQIILPTGEKHDRKTGWIRTSHVIAAWCASLAKRVWHVLQGSLRAEDYVRAHLATWITYEHSTDSCSTK